MESASPLLMEAREAVRARVVSEKEPWGQCGPHDLDMQAEAIPLYAFVIVTHRLLACARV
jgi:hypothetical protein